MALGLDDIDALTLNHLPLLIWFARTRNVEFIRLLLGNGWNADKRDRFGRSALHHIVQSRSPDVEIVDILLQAGADPNAREINGATPLDICPFEAVGLAKTLVKFGAGPPPDPKVFTIVTAESDRMIPMRRVVNWMADKIKTLAPSNPFGEQPYIIIGFSSDTGTMDLQKGRALRPSRICKTAPLLEYDVVVPTAVSNASDIRTIVLDSCAATSADASVRFKKKGLDFDQAGVLKVVDALRGEEKR